MEDELRGTTDRIVFTDIRAGEVTLERHYNDLVIRIAESAPGAGDASSIQVKETLDDDWHRGIEAFTFADGTTLTIADVRARLSVPLGTSGNDTLAGGEGDEILRGGDGDDTYVWVRGGGNDRVVEDWFGGSADRLLLSGVSSSDVTLVRNGIDVALVVSESAPGAGDGGSVTLTAELIEDHERGVETIVFADGVTWGLADLQTRLLAQSSTPGNDMVTGFVTNDTLVGGHGNDTLSGGEGDDTYIYRRGDGNDVVFEDSWSGNADRLVFADLDAANIELVRSDDDLLVRVRESVIGAGDGGSVLLKKTLVPERGLGVEEIVFADGTTWTYSDFTAHLSRVSIPGLNTDDPNTFVFGSGNERLVGNGNACTYVYWTAGGSGVVDDGRGSSRLWFFDIASTDVSIERVGRSDDLKMTVGSTGGTVIVHNQFSGWSEGTLVSFTFSDGVVWTANDVKLRILQQASAAGSGDVIGFYRSEDVLVAGQGDRYLSGGGGGFADTYVYSSAGGNDVVDDGGGRSRLLFSDIASTDVSIERVGRSDDLKVTILSTGKTVTVRNQFSGWSEGTLVDFTFSDGVVWTANDVKLRILAQASAAGSGDVIGFYRSEDVLIAGRGDRYLFGGGGDFADTYVYSQDGGNDVVDDGGGRSRLLFSDIASTDVSFERVSGSDDLTITIIPTGKTLTVRNQFSAWREGTLATFTFSDSVVWSAEDIQFRLRAIVGTSGNDTIVASDGNDTLIGGAGDDRLDGGAGSDTYRWRSGDGSDTISDWWNAGDSDELDMGGIGVQQLDFVRGGANNVDLLINDTVSGETVTVQGQFCGLGSGVESLVVGETTLDATAIAEKAWYRGGIGNDGFWGSDLSERFDGKGGDDTLSGGYGSDTYVYRSGDGNDLISDHGAGTDIDHLVLTDLVRNDVRFARAVSDLWSGEIRIVATGETIRLDHQFNGPGYGLEQIVFADGSTMSATDIVRESVIEGSGGTDYLYGSELGETFDGKGGADVLVGGAGSDTYLYHAGDGNDSISDYGSENDFDRLVLTDLNRSDVTFSRTADDVWSAEVHVVATGETIRLDHQFLGAEYGIEAIDFADGTSMTAADLSLAAPFEGTAATDYLYGSDASETFDGRLGDDVLVGGAGNDVYRYGSGDGSDVIDDTDGAADRLVFSDLTASDVRLLIVGDDLHLDVLGRGETITDVGHFTSATRGIDQIAFSGGTTWSRADITAHAVAA